MARRYSLGTTFTNFGDDDLPRIEQLERLAARRALHVLFEKRVEHLGVGFADRLELDHLLVAARAELRVFVEDERKSAAHPRREIAPRRPEYDDGAAGHVFAAVIADAFHHRRGSAVAHREALAGAAVEKRASAGGAVEDDVADDHLVVGAKRRFARRPDGDDAAREPLADVVVGVPFELEGHARRCEGAEALPRACRRADADGIVGKPAPAVAPRDLAAQHGAGGAVGVPDLRRRCTTGAPPSMARFARRRSSPRSSTPSSL